jgi:ABC-type multidrug transport system ATPase subunit
MTADAAIHVQGLEKSFKDLHVLRGVDFEVERGSILALLGSNGAGKTTVVRVLATLLRADAGSAVVNGFDVPSQGAEVRESISLTGQFAAVDEILTGRENLVLRGHAPPARHRDEPRSSPSAGTAATGYAAFTSKTWHGCASSSARAPTPWLPTRSARRA